MNEFLTYYQQQLLSQNQLVTYTPSKNFDIDSDQESIETTETNDSCSQQCSPIQKKIILFSSEIDVQPKKKNFSTIEEKQKFVRDYRKKFKTEVCKNWQIKGICPYGDKCCFAHGYHELKEKTHLKNTYKTKPCKKFFQQGYCPYGYRCQYLHSSINYLSEFDKYLENIYKEKKIPINLKINRIRNKYSEKLKQYTFNTSEESNEISSRLPIFQKIGKENNQNLEQNLQIRDFI